MAADWAMVPSLLYGVLLDAPMPFSAVAPCFASNHRLRTFDLCGAQFAFAAEEIASIRGASLALRLYAMYLLRELVFMALCQELTSRGIDLEALLIVAAVMGVMMFGD